MPQASPRIIRPALCSFGLLLGTTFLTMLGLLVAGRVLYGQRGSGMSPSEWVGPHLTLVAISFLIGLCVFGIMATGAVLFDTRDLGSNPSMLSRKNAGLPLVFVPTVASVVFLLVNVFAYLLAVLVHFLSAD